ncbi:hypothetical protein [Glutamicibacter protophormiae]|uniref:Secreted protein n=1 Tax=Glutamicibacter protophormiae TaxID=37930 RepID=A0ABS4XVE9_GLUPR|nr:hypothetical protein [Glutamicibacter protophormiae]MBP2400310.1 hypothetical protein [Glutamicibacter protophormiae]WPR63599.1 hypothetical protein SLW72_11965 [Glutamicibacter protophormiae]WPR67094.1 hypothetical protein SLW73_11960 [Glutamicibacter protophormiae]GGL93582.1 hypothetical protein GCM10010038_24380 [Glutamicibacter protophormiae]
MDHPPSPSGPVQVASAPAGAALASAASSLPAVAALVLPVVESVSEECEAPVLTVAPVPASVPGPVCGSWDCPEG